MFRAHINTSQYKANRDISSSKYLERERIIYDNFDYDKTIVLFQPHTYSRTKILLNDFVKTLSQVKNLWIYKTYPAREAYDEDGSAKRLAEQILSSKYFDDFDSVLSEIEAVSNKCSTLLIIGAGDVYDKIKKHIEKMRN